jgi:hypothetical protein
VGQQIRAGQARQLVQVGGGQIPRRLDGGDRAELLGGGGGGGCGVAGAAGTFGRHQVGAQLPRLEGSGRPRSLDLLCRCLVG